MTTSQTKPKSSLLSSLTSRQWLPALVVVIALYAIVPQLHVFRTSFHVLHNLDYRQLLLSMLAISLTFGLAAAVYKTLALRTIAYGRTLVAEIAANFINRLLPAGVGGIGANYRYLRKQRHTKAQAATVVAANNGLGLVGHALLVILLTTVFHSHAGAIHIGHSVKLVLLGIITLTLVVLVVLPKLRSRLLLSLRTFVRQFQHYRERPLKLVLALLLQLCLTLSNIAAFWLCVLAVHASLSFVAALVVFTVGFGVGTATPTPGGLGGIEAGLVAGLVAYHIASPTALAAVLVYRLISYWLPLVISGFVLLYASKHHYFGASNSSN